MAEKMIEKPQRQVSEINVVSKTRKAQQDFREPSHCLFNEFDKLPSGMQYRIPIAKEYF